MFQQKIFVYDRPLVLTTRLSTYLSASPEAKEYAVFEGAFPKNFRQAIEVLSSGEAAGAILTDPFEDNLREGISRRYKSIDAAGGLVMNEAGELLFIFRRGKWDLPKGKLDKGETLAVCAIREVQEETGIKRLVLGDFITDTFHVYTHGSKEMIKRTAWYKMRGSINETFEPQTEEDIEEVRWIPVAEVPKLTMKTFQAIREVIVKAGIEGIGKL